MVTGNSRWGLFCDGAPAVEHSAHSSSLGLSFKFPITGKIGFAISVFLNEQYSSTFLGLISSLQLAAWMF